MADIVDTEGYSIKNASGSSLREEYVAEANATTDILEGPTSSTIDQMIAKEQSERHAELINQMRTAIDRAEAAKELVPTPSVHNISTINPSSETAIAEPSATAPTPQAPALSSVVVTPEPVASSPATPAPKPARPDMVNLANNTAYSVETIQKEANRLKNKSDDEVYISLH